MTEKQIPESKIALNPVVIDDSKRGESKRGFYVFIGNCEDCPFKKWGLRKCGEIERWFDDFEIESGIPDWCPKVKP